MVSDIHTKCDTFVAFIVKYVDAIMSFSIIFHSICSSTMNPNTRNTNTYARLRNQINDRITFLLQVEL